MEQIKALRLQYTNEISALEAELKRLCEKLALINKLEYRAATIDQSIVGNYLQMGITKAIIAAVNGFGDVGGTSKEVRDHLLAGGFVPKGKNFKLNVCTILYRLVRCGRLKSQKKGWRNTFTAAFK